MFDWLMFQGDGGEVSVSRSPSRTEPNDYDASQSSLEQAADLWFCLSHIFSSFLASMVHLIMKYPFGGTLDTMAVCRRELLDAFAFALGYGLDGVNLFLRGLSRTRHLDSIVLS